MSNATLRPPVSSIPAVPTQFTTDNGIATPAGNNINILGIDAISNNDNGIMTTGSGSTVNVNLTNRATGTVTTTDNTPTIIITLPLGGTASTFFIYGNVQAFNSSTPAGASYSVNAAFRTTGGAVTFISGEFDNIFEEAALTAASASLDASGTSVVLSVTGINGLSINWNSLLEYRMVI